MSVEKNKLIQPVVKPANFEQMLIDCLGCKWTMVLLEHIVRGVNRPGKLVKLVEGLTTKVLNQNIARLLNYRVVEKRVYAEVPPKVEYQLTPFGLELYGILLKLKELQGKYSV
ncbi:winged helix-turn-helix transcriptional regulator [Pseudomonas sp.]|uniref:winged helix-turn-helix transcriptional regulator n=1 Tax=Pseudomonas sp. TaxID=306 RepID=UPI003BB6EC6B